MISDGQRALLEAWVEEGATLEEMAARLGTNRWTVARRLDDLGLKTLRAQRRRTDQALKAREDGSNRFLFECPKHGLTDYLALPGGRSRCARCNSEAVARRRRKVKEVLVQEAGGRCVLCGYNQHVQALEFHHLEPATKEFALSRKGVTIGIDRLRAEAAKCILLCSNCHAAVEAGALTVPLESVRESAA